MRQLWLVSLLSTLFSTIAIAESIQGPHGAVNFQNVNVCPARQTSPKPCSRTSKLNYSVTATTTFGETKVVTQGTPHLDFTLDGTTCTGTLSAGSSCTVRVKFAPRAPGVRTGAVQLTDPSGNLLVTSYVYGNGQGSVAAFPPGPQIILPVTGQTGFFAVAVDAAGDVFVPADGNILKFDPLTGVQTTVASGLPYASGLAVDGAGNIFASCGDPFCGVVEIAAGTGIQTPVGAGLSDDAGVAVDARGNLFIIDQTGGYPRLVKISSATGSQYTLLGGQNPPGSGMPLLNGAWGVAVDGADDVFIACQNGGPLYELTAGGVLASVGLFGAPLAVAVDAAGDLFVNNTVPVFELAAGTGILTDVADNQGTFALALDGAGDLFMTVNNTLVEVKSSKPRTLNFGKIAVGSTSAPQSVTIQNVGNQPLNAVAPGLIVGTNFLQVPGSGTPADCTSSFSLTPGASCNLSIVFAPQSVGLITGTATFTDNALNKIPSASQSVKLKGIGIQ